MTEYTELALTEEDYNKAFNEVSFLLDVLTRTIGQVVGQAAPSMAVSSGRHMARKLPVHMGNTPSIDDVMIVLTERVKAGFDMSYSSNGEKLEIEVGRCAIREVCEHRGLEVGTELCQMLHNFWSGMITELRGFPMRVQGFSAGDKCSIEMK